MRTTYSSNTSTFNLYQPQILKTVPEFKHDLFPYINRYQQMTSLFLHRMIKLWVPIVTGESHNFIPDLLLSPPKVQLKLPCSRIPLNQVPAETVRIKISQNRTQNLAAISFFNYIFNCDFNKTNLYMCQSPKTHEWYFVQDHAVYLLDYFKEVYSYKFQNITNQQLYADTPDQGEIQRRFFDTINLNEPWMASVFQSLSRKEIKSLCMTNLYELLLRISLTPSTLIHHLIQHYLKGIKIEDQKFFERYFISLVQMIKNNMHKLCSPEEYQNWQNFIVNQGYIVYLEYQLDVMKIAQEHKHIESQNIQKILHGLLQKAFQLKVPNLLINCQLPKIQLYPKSLYTSAFHYFLRVMQLEWSNVQANKNHVYWKYLNDLIAHLPNPQLNLFKTQHPFLDNLFLAAIHHHHNQIVKFIFQQKNVLKHQSHHYFDKNDYHSKILINTSTLFIALYYQNSEICQFLRQNFVRLYQVDELKFIELIKRAFLSNNIFTSQFYLEHYPDIFNHPNIKTEVQDTLSTCSEEIKQLFARKETEFHQKPSIPHPYMRQRRNSFFYPLTSSETVHDFSTLGI